MDRLSAPASIEPRGSASRFGLRSCELILDTFSLVDTKSTGACSASSSRSRLIRWASASASTITSIATARALSRKLACSVPRVGAGRFCRAFMARLLSIPVGDIFRKTRKKASMDRGAQAVRKGLERHLRFTPVFGSDSACVLEASLAFDETRQEGDVLGGLVHMGHGGAKPTGSFAQRRLRSRAQFALPDEVVDRSLDARQRLQGLAPTRSRLREATLGSDRKS